MQYFFKFILATASKMLVLWFVLMQKWYNEQQYSKWFFEFRRISRYWPEFTAMDKSLALVIVVSSKQVSNWVESVTEIAFPSEEVNLGWNDERAAAPF